MAKPNDPGTLAAHVRRLLEVTPSSQLPMTYQQVAESLGLAPPRTIQRVAMALESLMREDAEQGRPFIAALVVSRRGEGMPARGFFDLAVALGRFPDEPARHEEWYRQEVERVMAQRS
ncbi:hypothetical protein [Halomonas urumqiensis]|uniref:Uncharacterized protein n=1 Tax=Halomonas urumqiensis TaxID=1684789 RepID=A0A2N7UMZ1_9GAMM|nr:hypothetical protein [Halomonas urumqiensis]PMR81796.1 hypothetical protein C1H70_04700 [Halomonas urumqiensis]PTB02333.1 hypothetical protein C6V82_11680 [Halomonas urumqiensis]